MWLKAYKASAIRCSIAAVAFVCLLVSRPAVAADVFTVSTTGGYARLLFALTPAGQVSAQASGEVLTISFDRKVDIAPSAIAQALPGYIASARVDADGKTFRFALIQTVRIHSSASSGKAAVDLSPASYVGTPPNLPAPPPPAPKTVDVSKLEPIKVAQALIRISPVSCSIGDTTFLMPYFQVRES